MPFTGITLPNGRGQDPVLHHSNRGAISFTESDARAFRHGSTVDRQTILTGMLGRPPLNDEVAVVSTLAHFCPLEDDGNGKPVFAVLPFCPSCSEVLQVGPPISTNTDSLRCKNNHSFTLGAVQGGLGLVARSDYSNCSEGSETLWLQNGSYE